MQDAATDAAYLRAQAEKCRRLAEQITDDSARAALRSMADEYDQKAELMSGRLMDGLPHPKMGSPDALGK